MDDKDGIQSLKNDCLSYLRVCKGGGWGMYNDVVAACYVLTACFIEWRNFPKKVQCCLYHGALLWGQDSIEVKAFVQVILSLSPHSSHINLNFTLWIDIMPV